MVTPFGITSAWLKIYLDALFEGRDDREAKVAANMKCAIKGKDFARCRIRTAGNLKTDGNSLCLTIPVEGGSSVLKRPAAIPLLSEHGKWRREHLGAFNAAYGSTPFFEHLMPEIKKIYDNSQGITLEEFNSNLLKIILNWIDASPMIVTETLQEAASEFQARINGDISALEMLFRFGKNAALYFV